MASAGRQMSGRMLLRRQRAQRIADAQARGDPWAEALARLWDLNLVRFNERYPEE
jgi:hypothetical protein